MFNLERKHSKIIYIKMKHRFFYLVLIITFSFNAFAQNGSIKGRVFNEKTNEPLEFATVQIQGTTIGSTTDLDGNFIFTGITPGFVRLLVTYVGFEKTLLSLKNFQKNYFLKEK